MSRALRFLGVQAGEGPIAGGLFAYSLLLGVGRVFILTASQALFLEFYPASDLAYVYMIAAVATIATSAAYLQLGRRLGARDLILANLAFTLAVTLILRVLFGATDSGWPAMALAAWFHVMFALSSFAFWGAATQVVDIRQGKRLFPLATTGDVLAFSVGGLIILRTVEALGTANLLWIGAAGVGLAIAALLYTIRSSAASLSAPEGGADRGEQGKVRWSSPYIRLMMGYFVLSAVVFIFLDNAFNDVAQRRFEGAAELARFFATYSAVAAVVNFLFRSLLAGRLVRRFGLGFGLAVLPAVVGLGAVAIGLGGTLLPGLGVVFWFTVLTRMSDKVLRGVQYSSMATLYQPLMDRATAVQTTMDGIIDSAAIGLAGVALLALNAVFEITAVELSFFLVAFCAGWVALALALKGEFVRVLGGVLHRRKLRGPAVEAVDEGILDVVREQLGSEYPENVVYALELLARAEAEDLDVRIHGLLDHPSDEVRIEALRHLRSLPHGEAGRRLAELARDERRDPRLRAAAIRALGRLSPEAPPEVRAALEGEEPALRRAAIVGLLLSGSIEAIVSAGAALLDDLRSEDAAARASGAEVLRDAAIPSFFGQAAALLSDPDPAVRARAVEAAAAMDHPKLWPRVVDALCDPDAAPAASEALIERGPAVVPHLAGGLSRHRQDRGFRLAAVRVLGLVGGEGAAARLLPLLEAEDREERTAVLTALVRSGAGSGARAAGRPAAASGEAIRAELDARLETELVQAAEAFAALAELESLSEASNAAEPLRNALAEEVQGIRHRIFLLLALARPEGDLITAWENYASGARGKRAYALELLDSQLATDERGRIFPLLEDLTATERLQALPRALVPGRRTPEEWVARLLEDAGFSPWTRMCARRLAAELRVEAEALGENERLLFDRASRLARVELFRDLPASALARVVARLEVQELPPGRAVIRKGETGDSMFVILEGRVRVQDDGRELAVLEEDAVFGEFTVLQRRPRTATVTTLEPTRLLRFAQGDLQELMQEQVGVARVLIRVILRRLRENLEKRKGEERG